MNHFIPKLLATALAATPLAQAQVSHTGGTYTQDFNTLQGTTNNTTGVAWSDNLTLPGWYSSHASYGVTNGTMGGTAATFDGTSVAANVGFFSFGTAGSTDRALGSRATSGVAGNSTIYYGVRLVNNTAQTITAFNVMCTGEQWHKNGATTVHTLPLQYLLGATSVSSGIWTAAATFSSPVNTTTIASLDGNASANRSGVAARITGVSWAPGIELWLRIQDDNESGNEQAMGIDDFIFNTEGNSALFFNGATHHVTMGAATSTLGASIFTLESWIFRTGAGTTASTGTGGVNASPVVAKGRSESETAGLNCNYFMGIDASNRLVADFEAAAASGITTGQNYPVIGTGTIPFNQWTHLAASYDGTATDGEKWKLYINGVKDTTSLTPGVNTVTNAAPEAISTQHFAIGTAMNSTGVRDGTFLGLIDEVRVWNVARSGAQILAGKDLEISSGAGLLGRFGLNEGTGTTAVNSVAGSPNGTLTNSPVWMNGRSFTPNSPPAGAFAGSYSENFNSLPATNSAPPAAWTFFGVFGGSNGTWSTSILAAEVVGGTANGTLIATTTFTTSSDTQGFNFADPATPTDRALGTSPTSGRGNALQLELTNTGTEPVTKVSVAYDIRRFSAPAQNELPGYWLFYSQDDGATWTNVSALNPTATGPTGVIIPTTVGVTNVPATEIALASTWHLGSTLRFRWMDDNAVSFSPDQIVALDNVAILATETIPVIGIAPVVALTHPAANSSFLSSDTISIEADATDSDGTVTKVEFFRGAVKLGEDTTQPYAYNWSFPPAGSFSLTARATDSAGNLVSSAARVVTVTLAPGSSGPLLRSPYLNQANHNSIVVRWRSTQSNIGRVRYGLTPANLNLTTDEASAQTNHVVRLTGLTPASRYYYSVGSAVDILTPETVDTTSVRTTAFTIPAPTAADYTFRTSPVPGTAPAEGTRIWVVGDCGRGSATQAAGRDAYYNWMGSRTPDLNLQMGDNAYNAGTDAEYQTGYFQMYPTIFRKMTQWSTLGNHDANNGNTDPTQNWPYFDMFTFPTAGECGGTASGTEHYYSFDYGNVHFICLDSQTTLATRTAGAAQTVWLQNDLASTTQPWKIVFFHHPGYSKGSHNSDTESQMVLMREIYHPLLEAGGVDLVLTGHSHNYERSVLLDGHYGVSSTLTPAMKIDSGNGSTTGFTTAFTTAGDAGKIRIKGTTAAVATVNGTVIPPDGAYKKPLLGPLDHTGTIYNTAGMSGQADGGNIDHTAMYISYDTVGTVNLDITGNTLVATYVQADGNTPDNYTIVKSGEADRDRDGVSDSYEIANGLSRYNSSDAQASAGDSDGISNFLEFAFGLNPNLTDGGSLVADVPNGLLNQRGQPTVWYQSATTGTDFRALFIRRKNAVDAGLIYTPQFSGDLLSWTNSSVTPTVIADAGEVELVSVHYPLFAAGKEARFFRVGVAVIP